MELLFLSTFLSDEVQRPFIDTTRHDPNVFITIDGNDYSGC